jgi:D-glycero-D-manno-heptose 1,7-bisphosphate phosphatase
MSSNRALFLDRDGVINVDHDYVHKIKNFEFTDGIFELARIAAQSGLLLVVVTNQSGIGRGYYSEDEFNALTEWMCTEFEENGAPISRVYHCPFHPDFPRDEHLQFKNWRKPEPGMMLQASIDLGIDLAASFMVGDRQSDAKAASSAGILNIFLLASRLHLQNNVEYPVEYGKTIREAILWLEEKLSV